MPYTVTCRTADGVERTVEVTEGPNVCPIWTYHKDGRYLIAKGEAKYRPQYGGENFYVAPADATPVAPPERETGKIPVFDPESQTWSQVEDRSLSNYWSTEEATLARPVRIMDPVADVSVGLTTVAPCSYDPGNEHLCWNVDTCTWCAERNVQLTAAEKLAKVGLSTSELRELLGL